MSTAVYRELAYNQKTNVSPTLETAGQEYIYKSVFFLWYNLQTLAIMNELKRRQVRQSAGNGRGEEKKFCMEKQNGGLFKCRSKHIFLKYNSSSYKVPSSDGWENKRKGRKNQKITLNRSSFFIRGQLWAESRLKRKRKIGFHFRKLPILKKCSLNTERFVLFEDNNNNAKNSSNKSALYFSRWLASYLPRQMEWQIYQESYRHNLIKH